jgi:Uma2 family endonuclease
MSTLTSNPTTPVPLALVAVHRITVDEYERIIRAGALEDPSRVELIDGYLADKMAKNPEHSYSATTVHEILAGRLPAGWASRKEEPVRIPAYNEPEPDVSIVRGVNADYRHRTPEPVDVALLVEVSDSSLSQDRDPKLLAYARGGIPVYWIVSLVNRQVEVYTGPGPTGYQSRVDFKPGQHVPLAIGGQTLQPIAVDDILP